METWLLTKVSKTLMYSVCAGGSAMLLDHVELHAQMLMYMFLDKLVISFGYI